MHSFPKIRDSLMKHLIVPIYMVLINFSKGADKSEILI